jgi:uncharacterized protein YycO
MNIYFLIFTALVISGCSSAKKKSVKRSIASSQSRSGEYRHSSTIEIERFQNLMEENLAWRTSALSFYEKLTKEKVLKSDDIVKIHELGTQKYVDLREDFFTYIEEYLWTTKPENKIIITEKRPTKIVSARKSYKRSSGNKWKTYKKIYINPNDRLGRVITKKLKSALASALTLYDNYMVVLGQFEKLDKVRHLIDYDNSEERYSLTKISASFNKVGNYRRIMRIVRFHRNLDKFGAYKENIDDELEYFDMVINGSFTYKELDKSFRSKIWKNKFDYAGNFLSDLFKEGVNKTTHGVSKAFGNSVGLIQSRTGKLYDLNETELDKISSKLKPLDILLEKTPFRLTDKFIPGHWGHVAIWTGTKSELIALGLWDHELIRPYQKSIEFEGKRIIEALRPGVQINTLKHFMNIDDLAVVRHKSLSSVQREKYLLNAFKQIGKSYDFNFDVETDERIVCSELAYVTFSDLDWNLEEQVGRYTISPDNVGEKVTIDGEFSTILIFHDGIEAKGNLDKKFKLLMEKSSLD